MAKVVLGMTFERLTVLAQADRQRHVIVRCECGTERVVSIYNLLSGNTKSCGCLSRELSAERMAKRTQRTQGHTGAAHVRRDEPYSSTYTSWKAMRQRCRDENASNYASYGGRGIKVCDRWNESFAAFLADMGERPDGHTIDRIDVDGNYEPGNCRWATASEQQRNRRA